MSPQIAPKEMMKGISASERATKKLLVECRPTAWSRKYTDLSLGNNKI